MSTLRFKLRQHVADSLADEIFRYAAAIISNGFNECLD